MSQVSLKPTSGLETESCSRALSQAQVYLEQIRNRMSPESPDVHGTGKRDYLVDAAKQIRLALERDVSEDYEAAFNHYKNGVDVLLNGVQVDPNKERREAVKRKITKYLRRAEEIFNCHLQRTLGNGTSPGTVQLVQDPATGGTFVVKSLPKCHVETWNRPTIIPNGVPYMAKLLRYSVSEDSIFLHLEHVQGGTLWSHLLSQPRPQGMEASSNLTQQKPSSTQGDRRAKGKAGPGPPDTGLLTPVPLPQNHTQQLSVAAEAAPQPSDISSGAQGRVPDHQKGLKDLKDPDLNPGSKVSSPSREIQVFRSHGISSCEDAFGRHKIRTDVPSSEQDPLASEDITSPSGLVPKALRRDEAVTSRPGRGRGRSHQQARRSTRWSTNRGPLGGLSWIREGAGRVLEGHGTDQHKELPGQDCPHANRACPGHRGGAWCVKEEQVKQWAAETLVALEGLHQQGVLCRDLNPRNLLLDTTGHIRLTYFGQWTEVEPRYCSEALENLYSAPEVGGISELTEACDWWSFGSLLYELLTGMSLSQNHPSGIHVHTRLHLPEWLSRPATSLLTELLQFDPGRRLGAGGGGVNKLKSHPFFSNIQWNKLVG
uniref:Ribosomal protein S6 kinase-like 1 isoform X1 n=2 Tax=Phascolarctos cinereus TaxID=38626 RepID=A0A6P5KBI8_PHACI|nr:ribosomal protein S6 kinase-like 1 isoform X1 [Phascolarctos cinereus]XP_020841940.1 ribosomal protein S6 kinase-like 1 isoform X1 [Phascolarctos cinereus]XP_020841941.1 ribosomal protein S6 kinase-like 1 isoform X1 [Phascolarctos cinereus]